MHSSIDEAPVPFVFELAGHVRIPSVRDEVGVFQVRVSVVAAAALYAVSHDVSMQEGCNYCYAAFTLPTAPFTPTEVDRYASSSFYTE